MNIVLMMYIKKLACDELIMKIMKNLLICGFVHFTHKYHELKRHSTQKINVLTNEVWIYEWMNITQISHLPINPSIKCVFNAWY
jgi:hypothetical protein